MNETKGQNKMIVGEQESKFSLKQAEKRIGKLVADGRNWTLRELRLALGCTNKVERETVKLVVDIAVDRGALRYQINRRTNEIQYFAA
jgi:hypothetical protein